MEITATIEGLKALKEPCEVLLISDSQYLLNGLTSWRFTWREKGWMRKPKHGQERPVLNADLWQELDALADKHTIRGQWVKGHSGHPDNERCDELAEAQAAKFTDLPCWSGPDVGAREGRATAPAGYRLRAAPKARTSQSPPTA
jgi:ribonuclease HI